MGTSLREEPLMENVTSCDVFLLLLQLENGKMKAVIDISESIPIYQ